MIVERHWSPGPDRLCGLLRRPGLPRDLTGLRDRVLAPLHRGPATARTPRRLDAFVVERGGAPMTPFAWSARTARRSLGTRAAHALAAGTERDPLRAVRAEVGRLCDRSRCGLERRGGLGGWLRSAPPEARAIAELEAAAWAYELVALVAPGETGVTVGVADAWVEVPGAGTTLHARRDAVATAADGGHGLLRLRDGVPGAMAVAGLAVDGLIAVVAAADAPAVRIVGCWPDAGAVLSVELDDDALARGATLLEAAARPGAPSVRLAA